MKLLKNLKKMKNFYIKIYGIKIMTNKRREEMFKIISELEGTFEDIELDDFTIEELYLIDENIFHCDQCGWWFCTEECAQDEICYDCRDEVI